MKKERPIFILLIFIAILWGGGYPMSQIAFDNGWSPAAVLFMRSLIGLLLILPLGLNYRCWEDKKSFWVGIIAGIFFFGGYAFCLTGQSLGKISNAALLTSAGIVLVPVFLRIFYRDKQKINVTIATITAIAGGIILSIKEGLKFEISDLIVVCGTIFYAWHSIYLDKKGKDCRLINVVLSQFLSMAILSAIFVILTCVAKHEPISFTGETEGWIGVIYYGAVSGALGFLVQTWALQRIESPKVSLILSTEGLFAAIFAIIFYKEPVTWKIIVGGSLMIISLVLLRIDTIKEMFSGGKENG